jgi:hypothetical protein
VAEGAEGASDRQDHQAEDDPRRIPERPPEGGQQDSVLAAIAFLAPGHLRRDVEPARHVLVLDVPVDEHAKLVHRRSVAAQTHRVSAHADDWPLVVVDDERRAPVARRHGSGDRG